MTFEERMTEVVKEAESTNKITYLYFKYDFFFTSSRYLDNTKWLFKAYPGGRKVLSVEGEKIRQSLKRANNASTQTATPCALGCYFNQNGECLLTECVK